jgi:hypothetical protein
MHLVGYLYKDYHDARSLEHKVPSNTLVPNVLDMANLLHLILILISIQQLIITSGSQWTQCNVPAHTVQCLTFSFLIVCRVQQVVLMCTLPYVA